MTSRNDALGAFISNIERAKSTLSDIQLDLEDHLGYAPEDVHWGHVADAKWVADKLTEIVDGSKE